MGLLYETLSACRAHSLTRCKCGLMTPPARQDGHTIICSYRLHWAVAIGCITSGLRKMPVVCLIYIT